MALKVFVTNYHISVNPTMVKDLIAAGLEVIMPSKEFAAGRIDFYAPNDEHLSVGAKLIDYATFMQIKEPIAILTPCMQLIPDFQKLYEQRGSRDVMVYLTANSDAQNWYPPEGCDYLMTHDIDYHRLHKGKYKIIYFNRPTFNISPKSEFELHRTFDEKKVKLFINNFDQPGFEPEYAAALEFRDLYEKATGWRMPMFGYGMPDGWPQPPKTHEEMKDSMFTVTFKRRETWGQMVNESMQLGTPGVFLNQFIYSTFKYYLINEDTAVIGDTPAELVQKITDMTYPEYQTLVNEAYYQSHMFCDDATRIAKVAWLFDKVARDPKMKTLQA